MNKFLKLMFAQWDEKVDLSREAKQAQAIFCNSTNDKAEMSRREDLIFCAFENERTAAFTAGFYLAVDLLTRRNEK